MMSNLQGILVALEWYGLALQIHERHDHLTPGGMQLI